mmetsp:Transcript_20400/g.58540  ORF Transcript_20400/g.58540 Transcript_20400/m.58540 type:complete len:407 (-) Transcript_20400:116-1336(-)
MAQNIGSGDNTTLSKGVLVQIDGLASEAGKPLNGAYGLIASDPPAASASGGVVRYPVLVYALQAKRSDAGGDDAEEEETHQIIRTSIDAPKSLKSDNLSVLPEQKQKLFQDVARAQCQLAHQAGNHPGALRWYETYYQRWPDGDGDLGMVLTYVQLLMNFTKQPKKALEAIDHVKPLVKSSSMPAAMHDQLLAFYVQICTAAGERIEEAFEEASQIDASTEGGKVQAIRALAYLLQYASDRNETDLTRDNPDLLDLQVRVAQRIYELDPENVDNLFNLGAAHCLKGDNLVEGCKCYRRALASGKGDPFKIKYHENNLISAQLQCPGMPLEGYIIVTSDENSVSCIKESDKEYCKIVTTRTGFGKGSGSMRVDNGNGKDLDFITFPLPSSPDDPNVFPESFLDSLRV